MVLPRLALQNEVVSGLIEHLSSRRGEILDQWHDRVSGDPTTPPAYALSRQAFADHIPAVLDRLIYELSGLAAVEEDAEGDGGIFTIHGKERWLQGFGLSSVVADWTYLRAVLFEALQDYFRSPGAAVAATDLAHAMETVSELIDRGVRESIHTYETLRRSEAEGKIEQISQALHHLRRQFTAWNSDVAGSGHDLRGSTQLMLRLAEELSDGVGERLGEEHRERVRHLLDSLKSGLVFNLQLIEEMLVLARLDAGKDAIQAERFNASPLIHSIVRHVRGLAQRRDVEIHVSGPEHLDVFSDSLKLSRVVHNLLLNALQFTRAGRIFLHWERISEERWELYFCDSGRVLRERPEASFARRLEEIGGAPTEIAPEDGADGPRGRDRGYADRTLDELEITDETIRSRSIFGHSNGLGLSIVKRLCELLDGSLALAQSEQQGITVRIEFPLELQLAGREEGEPEDRDGA